MKPGLPAWIAQAADEQGVGERGSAVIGQRAEQGRLIENVS